MKAITCKFKIGDKVTHRPDLFGETESIVTEINRLFRSESGRCTRESDIKSIRKELNPRIETIDGIDYFVHDGQKGDPNKPWSGLEPAKSIFYSYSLVVSNSKMNSIISQNHVKLLKQ